MAQYEFNEQESQVIASVARRCTVQAILLGLVGVLALVPTLVFWGSHSIAQNLADLGHDLLYLFMGILFFRPADNFKRVATTRGNDITEVMTGLQDLNWGFQILIILISLLIVVNLIRAFI